MTQKGDHIDEDMVQGMLRAAVDATVTLTTNALNDAAEGWLSSLERALAGDYTAADGAKDAAAVASRWMDDLTQLAGIWKPVAAQAPGKVSHRTKPPET